MHGAIQRIWRYAVHMLYVVHPACSCVVLRASAAWTAGMDVICKKRENKPKILYTIARCKFSLRKTQVEGCARVRGSYNTTYFFEGFTTLMSSGDAV